MNKIIESHFVMGQDRKLTNLIIKSFGSYWKDEYLGQDGHIVYIDTKPSQIIISSVSSGSSLDYKKPYFTDYLKKIDYSDFDNLLLLVSTYPHYREINKKAQSSSKLKNKYLDMVLKETNGWLVYTYQLENLFIMATGSDPTQANIFRRNINKKLAVTSRESKKMKLFDTTLQAIIYDRMQLNWVCYPNYSKTYKLYQYLNL